jgi:hypothetical protein
MIPLGYMAKVVHRRDAWLKAPQVSEIYSVSSCLSDDFADWIGAWKHNGFWFFDSPALIAEVAEVLKADLTGTTLFYYEGLDREYLPESGWRTYTPEPSFPLQVVAPERPILRGFDVVTYSQGNAPECSPLSCNGLAEQIPTNAFCLLDSLEETKALLDAGRFTHAEPGPYRILAVYTVPLPS